MERSKNKQKRRLLLFTVFLFGIVVPFIPYLVIIEAFVLIMPFAIIFILTLIYLLLNFFIGYSDTNKALFIFSILPTFIVSQIFAVFAVDKVQRFRSEVIIQNVHQIKNDLGVAPEKFDTSLGITYQRLRDKDNFSISYSRGFIVTERYDSETGIWESYGWND